MPAWHNGIRVQVAADLGAPIEDGRENEGASRLTCNDVVLLLSRIEAVQSLLNASGVAAVIAKPCIRFRSE